MLTVKELLTDLVQIDSVSAKSNAELTDYAASYAEKLGLRVARLPYKDASGTEKINLIAFTGAENAAGPFELALVGHTDTVPYAADWTEALALTERDGKLYGRGSCDTKGYIAAALTALAQIELASLRRPLALVLTADEEIGCLGAKRLAVDKSLSARYAIVGEPTSLRPMRAGKGYCLADVVVSGREGHSAYPAVGASAIFRAARLITSLEDLSVDLKGEVNDVFDPPYTTLNVGLVNGGTAKNIIAGQCRFTLEWRPVPGQRPELMLEKLQEAIDRERRADPSFACEIIPLRLDSGIETAPDSPLVKLLEEATGRAAGTIAFGTEAPQMAELGAEAVVIGPGDIRVAHRTGEFVPVEELEKCVSILARAVRHFCGGQL
jgi:acetylornithine deacetylase